LLFIYSNLYVHAYTNSGNPYGQGFYSLSPRDRGVSPSLDLVYWTVDGTAKVVALLDDNAHPPPYFGPLCEITTDAGLYIAAVVHDGNLPKKDRWALTVFDPRTSNSTILHLQPQVEAEAVLCSISGLGMARN